MAVKGAGVILFTLFIAGCQPLAPLKESAGRQLGLPDQELYDATVRYFEAGRIRFTIRAPRIRRFEAGDLMLLDGGVTAEMFDADENRSALLTALEGSVVERDRYLQASGDVVVRSEGGMELRCDTLFYDSQTERVRSDGFVILVSSSDSLTGWGFSAAPDLSDWVIHRVSGETRRDFQRNSTVKDVE